MPYTYIHRAGLGGRFDAGLGAEGIEVQVGSCCRRVFFLLSCLLSLSFLMSLSFIPLLLSIPLPPSSPHFHHRQPSRAPPVSTAHNAPSSYLLPLACLGCGRSSAAMTAIPLLMGTVMED